MDDLDKTVNSFLSAKRASTSTDPLDVKVNAFLAKKSGGSPHPADDASLKTSNALGFLGNQSYNNLCEKFAEEQVYGKSGLFPSAADAWSHYAQNGKAVSDDPRNAPAGALIYFSPDGSNNGDGHTGIADGNGNIVAATSNGVQQTPIDDWIQTTKQVPLGYVIP